MSRRRRRTGRAAPARTPAARAPARTPAGAPGWERALRAALYCALGLLLLTPFVVTPGTVYPFVVGKALWSRALIEIAFALWAALALARPGYRPPRSWLLVLLGAGLGVSLLSAWLGVGPQRSLWSTYERMQGIVDQAHWAALAVVLAALLRSPREWRALLAASAGAGTAMACLVILRAADLEIPFFGRLPEPHLPRLGGPFGNPAHLGVHLLANLVLAAGFAVRAWSPATGGSRRWVAAAWAAAAAAHLAALVLAGSVGAFAGLAAAAAFAALAFAWLARGRRRLAAIAVLAVLAGAGAGAGHSFLDAEPSRTVPRSADTVERSNAAATMRYASRVHLQRPSVQSRLAAWETALEGFAARPLLGWGPENFEAVFGRFASGYASAAEPHDRAHGKLFEVAATAGAAGLAAWLALWGLALAVLLGAARAVAPPERAFTVLAAAALAGYLVQLQVLFDTAVGSLLATLLLAFAARLEAGVVPEAWRPRLPQRLAAPVARGAALLARREALAALGGAALALALAGLWVNQSILGAADARHVAPGPAPPRAMAAGIEAFPPLANTYRRYLVAELAALWPELRARDPAQAAALLAWAGREGEAAVRAEPANWRIERDLARLYAAASATDPDLEPRARRHLARSRALAPGRPVFTPALAPPGALSAHPLADGRVELRWRPSPGAGYHQIARSAAPGAWRAIRYAYDPATDTLIAPAGPYRYRIKACRYPGDCSAWEEWP